jgi:hypothetical protein
MKHTADSAQINHKADIMVGISADPKHPNAFLTSVIKMRDGVKPRPFMTGKDLSTMTLFDLDDPTRIRQDIQALAEVTSPARTSISPRKPTTPQFGGKR